MVHPSETPSPIDTYHPASCQSIQTWTDLSLGSFFEMNVKRDQVLRLCHVTLLSRFLLLSISRTTLNVWHELLPPRNMTQRPQIDHIMRISSLSEQWPISGLPLVHWLQIWFHILFPNPAPSPIFTLLVNGSTIYPLNLRRNLEDILSAFPLIPLHHIKYLGEIPPLLSLSLLQLRPSSPLL